MDIEISVKLLLLLLGYFNLRFYIVFLLMVKQGYTKF